MHIPEGKFVFRSLFSNHKVNGQEVEIIELCENVQAKDGSLIYVVRFLDGKTTVARSTELISKETYEEERKQKEL